MNKAICIPLASLMLALGGCANHETPANVMISSDQNAPLSASQQSYILSYLKAHGVVVVHQGDRLQLTLNRDDFFVPNTFNFKETQIQTMDYLAHYVHNYADQYVRPYPIHVSGYTNNLYGPQKSRQMAQHYAQAVAAYLWSAGFTSQQISVKGYGRGGQRVASEHTMQGRHYNERVVIQVN